MLSKFSTFPPSDAPKGASCFVCLWPEEPFKRAQTRSLLSCSDCLDVSLKTPLYQFCVHHQCTRACVWSFIDTCFCPGHHCGGFGVGGAECLDPGAPTFFPDTQTPAVFPSASLGGWLLCPLSFMPVRGAVMQTAIWMHTHTNSHTSVSFWTHDSELAKVGSIQCRTPKTPHVFLSCHAKGHKLFFFFLFEYNFNSVT